MDTTALIVAPPRGQEKYVTGLRLGERGRRVAIKAGVASGRAIVVRSASELIAALPRLEGQPLLFIRANRHIVALPLVEPLLGEPGARAAVDAAGDYAGAAYVAGDGARALLEAVAADFEAGDAPVAATFEKVEVGDRARHPAWTRQEVKAADAWQFQLIHKPLDGFLPAHYQRPLARPFTRMFLRLPLTPNMISVVSTIVSLAGCFIAAMPEWNLHIIGLAILLFGVILDACDGEVARLRMQESKIGAWLDAAGDDIARIGLILAMGFHVSAAHPDWPVLWIMAGTVGLTVTGMLLIYWYCIFVLGSSSNQDYEAVLGVGNNVEVGDGGKSLKRWLGDIATTAARRVFIDPAALILALLGLSWVAFAGLAAGSVFALIVILQAHIGIVQSRRRTRQAGRDPSLVGE